MAKKVIKPRPGLYKGVQYRSQLEIKWAKWLEESEIAHVYMDSSWFDFCMSGIHVEIKPRDASAVCDAIERAMVRGGEREVVKPGTDCFVVAGNPPSCYGKPVFFMAVQTESNGVLLCYGTCGVGVRRQLAVTRDYWIACKNRDELVRSVFAALGGLSPDGSH